MNFHAGAENPAAHPLHRHSRARPHLSESRRAGARLQGQRHAFRRNLRRQRAQCRDRRSRGLAAAPRSAGRWAMRRRHRAASSSSRWRMRASRPRTSFTCRALVTPISAIMIDPTGERTIVTFRDPELWKVKLPDADDAAGRLRTPSSTESRCARVLHRSLRRGASGAAFPSSSTSIARCRCARACSRPSSHLVFSSEPLQETAGISRRRRGAEEDRQADARRSSPAPAARAARSGSTSSGQLQETPAFPVHTVDTLGAGDVFHGAFALRHHRGPGAAGGAAIRLRRRSAEMHPLRRRLRRPATC